MQISTVDMSNLNFGCDFELKKQIHGTAGCSYAKWLSESRLSGYKYSIFNIDGLVKSLQGRHSRESGSPELVDFTGFPLSRE